MKTTPPLLIAAVLGGALALSSAFVLTAAAHDGKTGADDWVVPARAAKKKNPVVADASSLAKGKELYAQECMSCHGPTGKGDGPAVKDLEKHPGDLSGAMTQSHTDGALFYKISEGRKPMPALGEKLSEDQRWAVVNYIRTLAAGPAK